MWHSVHTFSKGNKSRFLSGLAHTGQEVLKHYRKGDRRYD